MTETPKKNITAKVPRNLYLAMEFKQCSNVKHIELLLNRFEKELLHEKDKEFLEMFDNYLTIECFNISHKIKVESFFNRLRARVAKDE